VSFAAITLCVASQRVFIVVSVYFIIDSVRKLLDTPSYIHFQRYFQVLMKTELGRFGNTFYIALKEKNSLDYNVIRNSNVDSFS
jgi:hypothetical protein